MSDTECSEVSMDVSDSEPDAPSASALFTDDKEAFQTGRKTQARLPNSIDFDVFRHATVRNRHVLAQILSHPRRQEFLCDAYVRVRTAAGVTLARVSGSKACDVYRVGEETCRRLVTAHVLERGTDGEVTSTERSLRADDTEEDALTVDELERFVALLERLPRSQVRLDTLPAVLDAKARQLDSFTFTEHDVEEMLRHRRAHDTSSKHLFMRRADIEVELDALKSQKIGKRHNNRQRVTELEEELARIDAQIKAPVPDKTRKRPAAELVGATKRAAGNENPFARRECRPTVMWATTESKLPSPSKPAQSAATAATLGQLPLAVQQRFVSQVVAWRAAGNKLDEAALEAIRRA